ncbi:hypothetical protein C0J52_21442 [Blattella germanica]|nr:hypothetical protein C0J52_21442 [Blattella germanica]
MPWITVGRNPRKNNQIIGTSQDTENMLEAAVKRAWLYIGSLKPSTQTNTVTQFLQRRGINGDILCKEVNMMGRNNAFKLGIDFNYLETTQKPDFWPRGTIVQCFRFPISGRRPEGVSLDSA